MIRDDFTNTFGKIQPGKNLKSGRYTLSILAKMTPTYNYQTVEYLAASRSTFYR